MAASQGFVGGGDKLRLAFQHSGSATAQRRAGWFSLGGGGGIRGDGLVAWSWEGGLQA